MDTLSLQPFFDEAPIAWSIALAVVAVGGFVLWIAGGRFAQAGVAIGGFFAGGVLATSAAAALEPGGGWVIGLGTAGALAGTLLAFLLFRLWVGLLAGLILAAVVPAGLLLWGVTPPATPGDAPDAAEVAPAEPAASLFGVFEGEREEDLDVVKDTLRETATAEARELAANAAEALDGFFDTLSAAWKTRLDAAREAWSGLPTGRKRIVLVGAAGGFVIGLLLGLAAPKTTAAVQTALVGACLLCGSTLLLLQRHAGVLRGTPASDGVPAEAGVDPRALLLGIGLVTLIGLLLQWTLGRKRADA